VPHARPPVTPRRVHACIRAHRCGGGALRGDRRLPRGIVERGIVERDPGNLVRGRHDCLAVPDRLHRVERPEDIPPWGPGLRRALSAIARRIARARR